MHECVYCCAQAFCSIVDKIKAMVCNQQCQSGFLWGVISAKSTFSLRTSKPTFDSTFFMVIFLFERHFQMWTARHFQIWTSISNLKVTCTFESHIWMSLSHFNVNLTFEHQSHIWTSISYLNVNLTFERHSHIWGSLSHSGALRTGSSHNQPKINRLFGYSGTCI